MNQVFKNSNILIIVLYLFLPQILSAKTTLDILNEADAFYKDNNYIEALNLYKNVSELNPDSIRALTGLAVTSEILGLKNDALSIYKRIIKLAPDDIPAITGISRLLADANDFVGAIQILEPQLKINPFNGSLLFAKAYIHFLEKKYNLAIHILEDISRRNDPSDTTLSMLANAYAGAGKYQKSFTILNELIEKNPENPELFITKAKIYIAKYEKAKQNSTFKQKSNSVYIDNAIESLDTALAINPLHPTARKILVRLKIYKMEFTDAEKLIYSLIKQFNKESELFFLAGYIYNRAENNFNAEKYFQKAIELNDLDESGRLLAEDFALTKLKENNPFRMELGKYRYNQAIRNNNNLLHGYFLFNLHRASLLIPENSKVKTSLADFYRMSGNLEAYINLLIQFRNENPGDYKIKSSLEKAINQLELTLPFKERLVKINPESVKINYGRTPKSIFLYDLKAEPLLASYPDMSRIFSSVIRNFLKYYPEFQIIAGKPYENFLKSIDETTKPDEYSRGVYFDNISQKNLIFNYRPVDYYLYGSGEFTADTIAINMKLTDRESGINKDTISIRNNHRDSAAVIAVSVANQLKKVGYTGKILRLNEESILVNMGSTEKLKINSLISIVRDGAEIAQAKITSTSKFISIAKPITKDFFRICKTGDHVTKLK